jgi:cell division protein FtsX
MDDIYPLMLKRYHQRAALVGLNKWTAGPVGYQTGPDGRLRPVPAKNDKFVWRDLRQGFRAPQLSSDTNYRRIKEELGSNLILGVTSYNPILRWVGLYDADKIRDYSELSEVPLTTYHAPDATPADATSTRMLAGRSLLPNGNLAGYLQQPPTVLTTLRGMKAFYDHRGFPDSDGSAPISVIRIRASGVSGPDAESRERVRVLAERIIRETGLDVDITIGSSPTDKVVTLPAGRYGRPELNLSEGWVHKGVTVVLLDAIDHKSLVVSLLVLGVCLLFLINATLAAVRTRRRELGVLSCVGWPRRRIFAVLEYELVTIGLIAGLLGTLAGGVLVWTAGLNVAPWQVLAITPLAALLAGLAGLVPIWRACSASPVDAIRPAGRAPRSASKVRSISGLAFAGMRRLPGRTFLGASCLFVGVAALTSLVAIQSAFHGQVIGTRLGDYVAVQVRGVDYLAAAITIGLGAFAIADIAFLNIRERVEEIGILQATGWSLGHLRQMFATEGIATAALGALTGTMAGLAGTTAFLTIGWQPALTGSLIATTAGLAAAILALTIPLARISRLAPAHALAHE